MRASGERLGFEEPEKDLVGATPTVAF